MDRTLRFFVALYIALVPLAVVSLLPSSHTNVLWAFVCTALLLIQVCRQSNG